MTIDTDIFRGSLNRFTEQAFTLLPPVQSPSILDIGCGSCIPSIVLCRTSSGTVTAVDIDETLLRKAERNIRGAGLQTRIRLVRGSLFSLPFRRECFDILWCEGAVFPIGFPGAITAWRHCIVPGGFCVIHDDAANTHTKLAAIPDAGYILIDHFTLSPEIWWEHYYGPLEAELAAQHSSQNEGDSSPLTAIQDEIAGYKKNPDRYSSIYIIMQKTGNGEYNEDTK